MLKTNAITQTLWTDTEVTAARPIDSLLASVRADMLDLSLNNPLLNFEELPAHGLPSLSISPTEVYDFLVNKRDRVAFASSNPNSLSPRDANTAGLHKQADSLLDDCELETPVIRLGNTTVSVPYSQSELDNRLLATYYASQTTLLEQGTVTLFIALGFLNWNQPQRDANNPYTAPLLLLPVALDRHSVTTGFTLKYTGDEIRDNFFLLEMLKRQGIALPSVSSTKDLNIAKYLDTVSDAITGYSPWVVDRKRVALGLFSFLKSVIYEDLNPAIWPNNTLLTHKTTTALLRGKSFANEDVNESPNISIDTLSSDRLPLQIVEADSSQIDALIEIRRGKNLVIQGPPGTGKSQTIVNIIADALYNNKTVLFVAEKQAALDVVKRRLQSVGLENTILDLSSCSTKRRSLFEQLRKTLDMRQNKIAQIADKAAILENEKSLQQIRLRLNSYCEQLHTICGNSSDTAYSIYGKLRRLSALVKNVDLPSSPVINARYWVKDALQQKRQDIEKLQTAIGRNGPPCRNLFWGMKAELFSPLKLDQLRQDLAAVTSSMEGFVLASRSLAAELQIPAASNMVEIIQLISVAKTILNSSNCDGLDLHAGEWISQKETIHKTITLGQRFADIRQKWSPYIRDDAWTMDVSEAKEHVNQFRNDINFQWLGIQSKHIRALNDILSPVITEDTQADNNQLIEIVNVIAEAKDIESQIASTSPLLSRLFGHYWSGINSNWQLLTLQTSWIDAAWSNDNQENNSRWLAAFSGPADKQKHIRDLAKTFVNSYEQYVDDCRRLQATLNLTNGLDQLSCILSANGDLRIIYEAGRAMAGRIQDVVALGKYLRARNEVSESLGEDLLHIADQWPDGSTHLLDLFEYYRLADVLESIYQEYPALSQFDASKHNQNVDTFRKLDTDSMTINRAMLANLHLERMRLAVNRQNEFETLAAMSEWTNNLPSTRETIAKSADAIQLIKPVFMMSPSSVANFLVPERIHFDLVIFDEASQLRPADVLGSIARGKQTIVVGDSKQLPPTTFFQTSSIDEEGTEYSTLSSVESILGLFCSLGAPQKMLRWHYRSKHESLIAQSNHLFYNNQLIVFPSHDRKRTDVGLIARSVNVSAGIESARDLEALEVAKSVIRFAQQQLTIPHAARKTMGVATLNVRHRDRILDQLELLRNHHPELEEYFHEDTAEPFFVKNLENLQGDERDVILISLGLGSADTFSYRSLGPIIRDGGERRVNVLFSRARRRCEIYSTIKSSHISTHEGSPEGLTSFRHFLHYAELGHINRQPHTEPLIDVSFEMDIAERIEKLGYTIKRNVGYGGFFIDLAVVDPREPEHYILGILTDGYSYRSAKTCRDRDRLREQILTSMGWNILRIWSAAWFQDCQNEEARIIDALSKERHAAIE
jgi:very-short-patch-repair endonuclease